MTLQEIINAKVLTTILSDIARHMGYSNVKLPNACRRITALRNDPLLGLYSASFDFKYSNNEFLSKLCDVLEIDKHEFKQDITDIEIKHVHDQQSVKPYIRVHTDFKRSNENLYSLGHHSKHLYLNLNFDINPIPSKQQLEQVSVLIKNHYTVNNGKLYLWGTIKRYVLVIGDTKQVFDTDNFTPML
jgi:hypothetical protein